jgi:hypothetical protein
LNLPTLAPFESIAQRCRSNEEGADVAALREEVEALARLEEEIDEHELIMHNSLRALAEDEENVWHWMILFGHGDWM